jgi:hypothetical protein
MSVDRLCSFYGFTRMPFGRDLAPGALFRSAALCNPLISDTCSG